LIDEEDRFPIKNFIVGMSRYRRRIATWMACFAVLLASLAPAVSHGINAFRLANTNIHEHCGENGETANQTLEMGSGHTQGLYMQVSEHADHLLQNAMPDDTSHAGHGSEGDWHFEHCPFCFTHAGSFGLAPVIFFTNQMDMTVALRPALFYRSHQPLFAWISAQPRAPPAIS
jgi:hypothetical protein